MQLIRSISKYLAAFFFLSLFSFCNTFAAQPLKSSNHLSITIVPDRVGQGQAFTVFVDSGLPLKNVELTGLDRPLSTYRIWHQSYKYLYRSFIGVPVTQKPGAYKIAVDALDENDEKIRIYAILTVEKADFKLQRVNLTKKKMSLLNVENLRSEGSILASRLKLRDKKVFFSAHFGRPTKGRMSSDFGMRRRYNGEKYSSYHKGIDIANKTGTVVKASNGGKVSLAMDMKSNGRIILINHGHGITSIYSHLSKIIVEEGAWVKKGQVIGEIGSTGISSGPHLHFGMSVNNVRVDPKQWLSSDVALYYNIEETEPVQDP
jgi:murein DD-endopeptidase MepM/ murein hydrolase activator NlpD